MTGYILITHGSKLQASNEESLKILDYLKTQIENIKLAFLELADPNFETAVKNLSKNGVKSIKVLPLFLAAGKHVRFDVPSLCKEFGTKYSLEIEILKHIGAHNEYKKLIKNILTEY